MLPLISFLLSLSSALLSATLVAALIWRSRAQKGERKALVSRLTHFIVVCAAVVVVLNLARFGLCGEYLCLIAAGVWGVVLFLEIS